MERREDGRRLVRDDLADDVEEEGSAPLSQALEDGRRFATVERVGSADSHAWKVLPPVQGDPAILAPKGAAAHPADLTGSAEFVQQARQIVGYAGRQDVGFQHRGSDR